jgi:hypothetical protein
MNDNKNEVHYIFIGGVYTDTEYVEKFNRSRLQLAANNFQKSLIEGFSSHLLAGKFHVINALFIGSYPKQFKKAFIKKDEMKSITTYSQEDVEFLNIPFFKFFSKYRNILKELNKFDENMDETLSIIIYSVHTPFLLAATRFKKRRGNVEICIIVPDLPEYMNLSANKKIIYKVMKKIDIFVINKKIKAIDRFVLLTEQMNTKINPLNKPSLVIEGLYKFDQIIEENNIVQPIVEKDNNQRIITYTGSLNSKYGVIDLLKAFHLIEKKKLRIMDLWRRRSKKRSFKSL